MSRSGSRRHRHLPPLRSGGEWLLLLALLWPSVTVWAGEAWLLVDTQAQELRLMQDGRVRRVYQDIAIGRYGVTADKRVGDDRTPLGVFHILDIRDSERFHRFLALDYPTPADARRARAGGRLSERELIEIGRAARDGRAPPLDTPLGGNIGIHGLGRADPRLHHMFNWTEGCIALTDAQIDDLLGRVHVGMRVVIL